MTTAPLCLLTLLLAARSASTEGESELCPAWTSKAESRVRVFQRPQEREGADATFCWGTCSLPCCCASGEARLGQRRCPRALHLEANAAGGPEPPQSPIHNLLQSKTEALLCALVLLLAAGGAATGAVSKLCRAWAYGAEASARALPCPAWRDGADAKFCRGTRRLPFCCSSGEARLEQQRCPRALHLKGRTVGVPPPTQALTGPRFHGWIGILLFLLAAGAALFYTIFRFCRWKYRKARWQRKNLRHANLINERIKWIQQETLRQGPFHMLGVPPPYSADSPTYNINHPPSYSDVYLQGNRDFPPPLPDSVVQFHRANAENTEDEVVICPLLPTSAPGDASQPTLEAEPPVDQ
ncbi:protein shisa-2 homolog [Rhineura floridana]|uniref:protein shisa-2 homolog n=1 Tax=Rhineura floridana TaxID=261503 RepID=UPI002AC88BDD|nr:protein shisa-2 homolog [Rhineura floridana]